MFTIQQLAQYHVYNTTAGTYIIGVIHTWSNHYDMSQRRWEGDGAFNDPYRDMYNIYTD